VAKRRIMLTFNSDIIGEAIIYSLGQQFNIVTNIRQAEINESEGWAILDLDGEEDDIEEGITWLISRGVRVEPINNQTNPAIEELDDS
jgi:hypothetical protein